MITTGIWTIFVIFFAYKIWQFYQKNLELEEVSRHFKGPPRHRFVGIFWHCPRKPQGIPYLTILMPETHTYTNALVKLCLTNDFHFQNSCNLILSNYYTHIQVHTTLNEKKSIEWKTIIFIQKFTCDNHNYHDKRDRHVSPLREQLDWMKKNVKKLYLMSSSPKSGFFSEIYINFSSSFFSNTKKKN